MNLENNDQSIDRKLKASKLASISAGFLLVIFTSIYGYYIPRMLNDWYAVRGRNLYATCVLLSIFVFISIYYFIKTPLKNRDLKITYFFPTLLWFSIWIILIPAIQLFDVFFFIFPVLVFWVSVPFYILYLFKFYKYRNELDILDKFSFLILVSVPLLPFAISIFVHLSSSYF